MTNGRGRRMLEGVRGRQGSAVGAACVAGLSIALVGAGATLHILNRHAHAAPITDWWVTNALSAVALGLPGGLIAAKRPRNPIGWILAAVGIGHALTLASREYAVTAIQHGWPGAAWAVWTGSWTWLDIGLLAVVFALFPSGRVDRSPLRAGTVVFALVVEAYVIFGNAVYPGTMTGDGPLRSLANPLGWAGAVPTLDRIGYEWPAYLLVAACVAGVAVMLNGVRASTPAVRRQVLVVTPAALLFCAEMAYEIDGSDRIASLSAPFVVALVSVAIAAAILRYNLYELDLVVSRTLVYGVLTALLAGAYLATVALVEAFAGRSAIASISGAALVAALFAPVRSALQDVTDSALFGARNDPYAVMASLSAATTSADVLPALAETVARTLKLPYVAIRLEGAPEAEVGTLRGEPAVLPVAFGSDRLGTLTLGRRAPSDAFTRAELRLFEDIARQVGVAARAVLLTREVQQSRERIVTAREEERRRLRRDLHDGLGPTLAGIALQLGSARTLLHRDADAADELLAQLVSEAQAAIADVRRLVYDLRPPALDELGLVDALRQHVNRFPGLEVEVVAPPDLSGLPAAVEVAAFRIATEAVTNVVRHANASRCVVELSANGSLELLVADDGRGLPPTFAPGVGLTSIRERAAELGGSCAFGRGPAGGTLIRANLPLVST